MTVFFGYDKVMEQPTGWQLLVLGLSLVLVVLGFIWLLYWRQDQLHLLTSPPVSQPQNQLSLADLDRQELQPRELPETIDAQTNPDLYTALKTVRGEVIQLRVLCIFAQKYTLRGMQNHLGPESNPNVESTFHRESHFPTQ